MSSQHQELYRARFVKDATREVAISERPGQQLELKVTGFTEPLEVPVTGGGVTICATVLKHKSQNATVMLILAIPDPLGRCASRPSSISIRSKTPAISAKSDLIKADGMERRLRNLVRKKFGDIDSE